VLAPRRVREGGGAPPDHPQAVLRAAADGRGDRDGAARGRPSAVWLQVGEPTKLPGPLTIEAVAVPEASVPLSAFTVIVSTWVVPIGFVADAGVIWMFAFTQVLFALPLPPAAVFAAVAVARVIVTPLTGMFDVAETTVVPVPAEVIVTCVVPSRGVHAVSARDDRVLAVHQGGMGTKNAGVIQFKSEILVAARPRR
jgi:hypothetical protein